MPVESNTAPSSSEGSSAVINAIFLPVAIISGTFFTPNSYPHFLRVIAEVTPLTHYTRLTRDVMIRGQHLWPDWRQILVVGLWGAIGLAAIDEPRRIETPGIVLPIAAREARAHGEAGHPAAHLLYASGIVGRRKR